MVTVRSCIPPIDTFQTYVTHKRASVNPDLLLKTVIVVINNKFVVKVITPQRAIKKAIPKSN